MDRKKPLGVGGKNPFRVLSCRWPYSVRPWPAIIFPLVLTLLFGSSILSRIVRFSLMHFPLSLPSRSSIGPVPFHSDFTRMAPGSLALVCFVFGYSCASFCSAVPDLYWCRVAVCPVLRISAAFFFLLASIFSLFFSFLLPVLFSTCSPPWYHSRYGAVPYSPRSSSIASNPAVM